MRLIPLKGKYGRGRFAVVDDNLYDYLNQWSWKMNKFGYVFRKRSIWVGGKRKTKTIKMHKLLLPVPKGYEVDHVRGHTFDNRIARLRAVTRRQNRMNTGKIKRQTSSQYKGVQFRKDVNKWRAYIMLEKKQRHLGFYEEEKEAAKAYDTAARSMFGEYARLNFQ